MNVHVSVICRFGFVETDETDGLLKFDHLLKVDESLFGIRDVVLTLNKGRNALVDVDQITQGNGDGGDKRKLKRHQTIDLVIALCTERIDEFGERVLSLDGNQLFSPSLSKRLRVANRELILLLCFSPLHKPLSCVSDVSRRCHSGR